MRILNHSTHLTYLTYATKVTHSTNVTNSTHLTHLTDSTPSSRASRLTTASWNGAATSSWFLQHSNGPISEVGPLSTKSLPKDDVGNIRRGNTVDVGSRDSIVFAGERLVATIGLKDMVVVDTPDATLVTPKERVQEIRKIVEELKRNGREEHLLHRTVERPWGSYTVLEKGQGYKIKRVVLKPKARLSLQLHRERSEHWVVVEGTAKVTRENETYLVQKR